MNIFEIAVGIGTLLLTLYMLDPLYIVFKAMRWQSQNKLIARVLK